VKNFVETVKKDRLCKTTKNPVTFQQGAADEQSQSLQGFPQF